MYRIKFFSKLNSLESSLNVKGIAHTRVTSVIILYIWKILATFLCLAEIKIIYHGIKKYIIVVILKSNTVTLS